MRIEPDDAVLALDLATKWGWCLRRPKDDAPIASGWDEIYGNDYGAFGACFTDQLEALILSSDPVPKVVVYESPVLPSTTHITALRKLYPLPMLVEMLCRDLRLLCLEEDNNRARAQFLRPGRLPKKSADRKKAVLAQCRFFGWRPTNDDEADAMALCDYTLRQLGGRL